MRWWGSTWITKQNFSMLFADSRPTCMSWTVKVNNHTQLFLMSVCLCGQRPHGIGQPVLYNRSFHLSHKRLHKCCYIWCFHSERKKERKGGVAYTCLCFFITDLEHTNTEVARYHMHHILSHNALSRLSFRFLVDRNVTENEKSDKEWWMSTAAVTEARSLTVLYTP